MPSVDPGDESQGGPGGETGQGDPGPGSQEPPLDDDGGTSGTTPSGKGKKKPKK